MIIREEVSRLSLGQKFASLRQPERRPQVLLTSAVAALLLAALAGNLTVALSARR